MLAAVTSGICIALLSATPPPPSWVSGCMHQLPGGCTVEIQCLRMCPLMEIPTCRFNSST